MPTTTTTTTKCPCRGLPVGSPVPAPSLRRGLGWTGRAQGCTPDGGQPPIHSASRPRWCRGGLSPVASLVPRWASMVGTAAAGGCRNRTGTCESRGVLTLCFEIPAPRNLWDNKHQTLTRVLQWAAQRANSPWPWREQHPLLWSQRRESQQDDASSQTLKTRAHFKTHHCTSSGMQKCLMRREEDDEEEEDKEEDEDRGG